MQTSQATMRTITSNQAKKLKDALFIDVRTPSEYRSEHIPSSINMPLDSFGEGKDAIPKKGKQVVLVCRSGMRSGKACEQLSDQKNVHVLDGGIISWKASSLPLIIGKSVWDLERQVRFAAGSLVFAGGGIGYYVHPLGYLLSTLVGLGLVFAAATNTCAMGMLISKMPWNRLSSCQKKD